MSEKVEKVVAGGAGAIIGGGGAASATSVGIPGIPLEFGDQDLLKVLATEYEKFSHNKYYGNAGGYTVKSGRLINYKGKLYYVIEKGANTLEELQTELDITTFLLMDEEASAPHVSKLVAAKLNSEKVEGRKRPFSGLFIFDSENSQVETLGDFIKYRNIDVSLQKVYNDLENAIVAIHTAGIIHRDIKPENIVILYNSYTPEGKLIKSPYPYKGLRIIDFGFAVPKGRTVTPAGTPGYMPVPYPEIANEAINMHALYIIKRKMGVYSRRARRNQYRRRKSRRVQTRV